MKIWSRDMNQDFLKKLQTKSWYPKIEKYLKAGTPPSETRKNLEKAGLSEDLAHTVVKGLWNLAASKIRSSEELDNEFVSYLQNQGFSTGADNSEYCSLQLAVGALVEAEHTDNFDIAVEIAKDHLAEDPNYYGSPNFTSEAIDRISDMSEESYSDGYLEIDASIRNRVFNSCRSLLRNNKHVQLGPLSLCSSFGWADGQPSIDELLADSASAQFLVNGKPVWLVAYDLGVTLETSEKRYPIPEEYYSSPAQFVISQYLSVPLEEIDFVSTDADPVAVNQSYTVPVRSKFGGRNSSGLEPLLSAFSSLSLEDLQKWDGASRAILTIKNNRFVPNADPLSVSLADFLNSSISNYTAEQTLENYLIVASEMAPIEAEGKATLNFDALAYYKQAGHLPSFPDYVGYLEYTGEFKDYASAYRDWGALMKKLCPVE